MGGKKGIFAYNNMMNKYIEQWRTIAAEAKPWEGNYGLDALIIHLRWMREYYALGIVHCVENKEWDKKEKHTRLETLELALTYYDKWQNLENEYIQIVPHDSGVKYHQNENGTYSIDDPGYHCIYKYGPKGTSQKEVRKAMIITYRKLEQAQNKYKRLFFRTVEKYLESWWD